MIGLIFALVAIAVVVVIFIFWIAMLIDVINNQKLDSTMKIIWFIVVFFGHLLGAIVYYFVGRNPAPKIS